MTKRAFTLIELLIVVAIIAILAAIAVPNFLEAQTRSKISRAMADMRSLCTAVEAYAVDYNRYLCDGQERKQYAGFDCVIGWTQNSERLTSPVAYMSSIPNDPFVKREESSDTNYWYTTKEGYGLSRNPGRPLTIRGKQNIRLYDTPRDNYKFAFISPGPDRYWEWDKYNWGWNEFDGDYMPYDATNGTVSLGDVFCYGSGCVFNPPADW